MPLDEVDDGAEARDVVLLGGRLVSHVQDGRLELPQYLRRACQARLIFSARRQTYSGLAYDDYWLRRFAFAQAGYGVILGNANRDRFGGGR